MTTFTVTTAADVVSASDGKLSLREAVTRANEPRQRTRSCSRAGSRARR